MTQATAPLLDSTGVLNHEEDLTRLKQNRSDTEKIASPNVRCDSKSSLTCPADPGHHASQSPASGEVRFAKALVHACEGRRRQQPKRYRI